jgi:hypothetical protein
MPAKLLVVDAYIEHVPWKNLGYKSNNFLVGISSKEPKRKNPLNKYSPYCSLEKEKARILGLLRWTCLQNHCQR